MTRPQDVNPRNFKVNCVIYDDGQFSIAWGTWEDDTRRLAMRWNGNNGDPGYPKLFKHPVWFVLPPNPELSQRIAQSLLGSTGGAAAEILTVLKELFPE